MKYLHLRVALVVLGTVLPSFCQTSECQAMMDDQGEVAPTFESSSNMPMASALAGVVRGPQPASRKPGYPAPRPFSSVAIAVKMGLAGLGLDLAVPMASRLNFRAGGSFLSVSPNLTENGIAISGDIQLRSMSQSFDFFPFGNSFRISPGVTIGMGNRLHANSLIPAGQDIQLNGVDYVSSTIDPMHGTLDVSLGRRIAPSLTVGFGNMFPRKGGHWSMPVEIGVEYIGHAPRIAMTLNGTACTGDALLANCGPIASNPLQIQDLQAEQAQLNHDIPSALRFFPIVSTGLSYRFGHAAIR